MSKLKTFTVPKIDSIKWEFGMCKQANIATVSIKRAGDDHYHLYVDGKYVGFLLGKTKVCGQQFAFVPEFDSDCEIRVNSLTSLIWDLSEGYSVQSVVSYALSH